MSASSFFVRPATAADALAIVHIHVLAWQQAYAGLMADSYLCAMDAACPRRTLAWQQAIAAGRDTVLLAFAGDQPVGFLAIGACRDQHKATVVTGEVIAFYVLPAYWREGVGCALWGAGVHRLVEQGYRQAMLWVLSDNARARRFYDRAGWSAEPASERSLLIGGASLREIRYRSPMFS